MTIFQFILLGLLQGLTEFLPISSSGHLLLFGSIFGLENSLFVSIFLHVATLLSILVVMRKEMLYLLRHPFSQEMKKLCFATFVTIIVVMCFYGIAKNAYVERFLPFFFMFTAIILFLADFFPKKGGKKLLYKQSFFMGIAQGIAIFPGISRSGSTICVGLLCGGKKAEVSKFSFLMSVPIICASMFIEILELGSSKVMLTCDIVGLIFGFFTAFIVGILALKIMIKHISKIKLRYFTIYLVILSVILLFV